MKTNYERAMIITLLYWIATVQADTLKFPKPIVIGFMILTGIYFMIVVIRYIIRTFHNKSK